MSERKMIRQFPLNNEATIFSGLMYYGSAILPEQVARKTANLLHHIHRETGLKTLEDVSTNMIISGVGINNTYIGGLIAKNGISIQRIPEFVAYPERNALIAGTNIVEFLMLLSDKHDNDTMKIQKAKEKVFYEAVNMAGKRAVGEIVDKDNPSRVEIDFDLRTSMTCTSLNGERGIQTVKSNSAMRSGVSATSDGSGMVLTESARTIIAGEYFSGKKTIIPAQSQITIGPLDADEQVRLMQYVSAAYAEYETLKRENPHAVLLPMVEQRIKSLNIDLGQSARETYQAQITVLLNDVKATDAAIRGSPLEEKAFVVEASDSDSDSDADEKAIPEDGSELAFYKEKCERLQQELIRLTKALDAAAAANQGDEAVDQLTAENEKLKAENKKLRQTVMKLATE